MNDWENKRKIYYKFCIQLKMHSLRQTAVLFLYFVENYRHLFQFFTKLTSQFLAEDIFSSILFYKTLSLLHVSESQS